MSLGARIREARIKLGLTQSELALSAKVGQESISKIELGKAQNPRSINILKISAALKTTPEYLMYGTKQKPTHDTSGEVKKLVDICKGLSLNDIAKLIAAAKALRK